MARLTRQKNFGMAKAVKKSPIQKANNGKSSNKPVNKQQAKNTQSNRRQTTTNQARSTQSIQKREMAQKSNNVANRRSATINGSGGGRKATPKADEPIPSKSNSPGIIICGQANVKTDELRKAKTEQQKLVRSSSSGDTSPSIFDETSISMYQALEYAQKPDSTVLSSDLLANAFNDVVINSSDRCPESPDLFETESIEGDACSNSVNREQNEKVEKIEMVSAGVQCKLSLETQTDAQVGTDDNRIRMIDVGVQTSPLPCAKCQTNASCGSACGDIGDIGGNDDNGDIGFTNFNQFDGSDDSYDSSESDSSYDHCLDDFDCLEHFDDNGNPYPNATNYNGIGRERQKMDEAEPVIGESPPRNQVYKNHRFHSPESLELNSTRKTSLKY